MAPRPSDPTRPAATTASAALLIQLEAISRARPDRVLRLRGLLDPAAVGVEGPDEGGPPAAVSLEPFELVIYRGFSSSTTHPTGYDPDQPALPEGALIEAAELLRGPLHPAAAERLAGPAAVEVFLEPTGWG